jgi:hypothetical protein
VCGLACVADEGSNGVWLASVLDKETSVRTDKNINPHQPLVFSSKQNVLNKTRNDKY